MEPVTETIVNTVYIVPQNMLVIGFVAVIAMLLIIMILVVRSSGRKSDAPQRAASAPSVSAAPSAAPAFAGVDPQVVAAISAAVAMMEKSEGKRLVVRAVRRTGYNWADSGRRDSQY